MRTDLGMLVPVSAPWKISPSVPHLLLQSAAEGVPLSATFIAFFKCEPQQTREGLVVVSDPGLFVRSETAKGSSHRLVQVIFDDGQHSRRVPGYSEYQIVAEDRYDWSFVPSGIHDGETAEDAVPRISKMWLTTGICPDPAMYEVRKSEWLAELRLDEHEWHHYLMLGHDDYIEVIARGWKWIPGQAVA